MRSRVTWMKPSMLDLEKFKQTLYGWSQRVKLIIDPCITLAAAPHISMCSPRRAVKSDNQSIPFFLTAQLILTPIVRIKGRQYLFWYSLGMAKQGWDWRGISHWQDSKSNAASTLARFSSPSASFFRLIVPSIDLAVSSELQPPPSQAHEKSAPSISRRYRALSPFAYTTLPT